MWDARPTLGRNEKAAPRLRRRSTRLSRLCAGVARVPAQHAPLTGKPSSAATGRAIAAAWLYPRCRYRRQCSGTGTTRSQPTRSRTQPLDHRAPELGSQILESSKFEPGEHGVERRLIAPGAEQPVHKTAAAVGRRRSGSRRAEHLPEVGHSRRKRIDRPPLQLATAGAAKPQGSTRLRNRLATCQTRSRQEDIEKRPQQPARGPFACDIFWGRDAYKIGVSKVQA